MANYSAIKAAVNAYIKQNGRKEITGRILNGVLNATIDSLGRYFQFVGGANPSYNPGLPDENVCFLSGDPGVYTHFGGITIAPGEVAVLKFNGEWEKETIILIPSRVSDLENDLGFITKQVADLVNYHTKEEIESIISDYYDRDEVDSLIDAIVRQSYVVTWDGTETPVVSEIPDGVVVTFDETQYTGTLPP